MKRSANAPGPEPIFSAATPKSPPPGTACRDGHSAGVRHG